MAMASPDSDPAGLATLKPKVCFTWKSKLYDNATSGKHNKVKISEAERRRLVARRCWPNRAGVRECVASNTKRRVRKSRAFRLIALGTGAHRPYSPGYG